MADRRIWFSLRQTSRLVGRSILIGIPPRMRFYTCRRARFGCIWETLLEKCMPVPPFSFLRTHGFRLPTLEATPSVFFVFFRRRVLSSLCARHQHAKERKTFR